MIPIPFCYAASRSMERILRFARGSKLYAGILSHLTPILVPMYLIGRFCGVTYTGAAAAPSKKRAKGGKARPWPVGIFITL